MTNKIEERIFEMNTSTIQNVIGVPVSVVDVVRHVCDTARSKKRVTLTRMLPGDLFDDEDRRKEFERRLIEELVTGSTAEGLVLFSRTPLLYALGRWPMSPDHETEGPYSPDIPEVTDKRTNFVWVQVQGDALPIMIEEVRDGA